MISLLISLLVFLIVAGIIYYIITLIHLPPPFPLIIQLVFAVICLLVVLGYLLPLAGVGWYGNNYHHLS